MHFNVYVDEISYLHHSQGYLQEPNAETDHKGYMHLRFIWLPMTQSHFEEAG